MDSLFVKRISDRIGLGLELDCAFRKVAFQAARGGGLGAQQVLLLAVKFLSAGEGV